MRNSKLVHETYHKKTHKQLKIISSKNFTYRILLPQIEKYLDPQINTILDIGCGAGTLCFFFANQGYQVTGIDISDRAISECKKSAKELALEKNTKFLSGDFQKKKISQKFDLVIFTEVIEHLENDKFALKKIYNLLNTNGTLILSTPSQNAPLYRLGLLKKFDHDVGHLRRYRLTHLTKLIKESGFKIVETKKSEGIVRNFLFTNPIAGKSVRVINKFGGRIVTIIDNICLKLFGESQLFVVAQKKS